MEPIRHRNLVVQNDNARVVYAEPAQEALKPVTARLGNSSFHLDNLLGMFVDKTCQDAQEILVNRCRVVLDLVKLLSPRKTSETKFEQLFQLGSLIVSIRLLRKDIQKFQVCKLTLEAMCYYLELDKPNRKLKIRNKLTINQILTLFKTLNETTLLIVNYDHNEHISDLAITLVQNMIIEDFKDRLDFYARCRASLGNSSRLFAHVTRESFKLAEQYRATESKRRSRHDFLNACLAFSYVTIPSIHSAPERLDLLLEGANLALKRTSLSLADYYLRLAIETLDELCSCRQNESTRLSFKKDGDELLRQVKRIIKIFENYQDQIDLEHKLNLKNLVESSFATRVELTDCLRLMKLLDL